jgi:hypothetical protein
MSNQQITTEDGGAYGIPSGQRRLRDGHAFLLCGDWYFMADGEPVKLENGAEYIVEFPFTGGPHGDVERTVVEYEDGFWFSTNDSAYADGPTPVDVADYRVIRKVDLWAA